MFLCSLTLFFSPLQVLGAFQKAWYQFTITADIDPNFEDAYEGRAIVSLQMNNTLGALHDMNAALGVNMPIT